MTEPTKGRPTGDPTRAVRAVDYAIDQTDPATVRLAARTGAVVFLGTWLVFAIHFLRTGSLPDWKVSGVLWSFGLAGFFSMFTRPLVAAVAWLLKWWGSRKGKNP